MVLQQEKQYDASHVDESKVLINASDARKFPAKGIRGANGSTFLGKSSFYKAK